MWHLREQLEWHATMKEEVSVDAFTNPRPTTKRCRSDARREAFTRAAKVFARGSGRPPFIPKTHPRPFLRPKSISTTRENSQHRAHTLPANFHPRLHHTRAWQTWEHTRPSAHPIPNPQNTSSPHLVISSGDVRRSRHPLPQVRRRAEDDEPEERAGLARRRREIRRRVIEQSSQHGR